MAGFKWIKSLNGNTDAADQHLRRLGPSLTVLENDLLKFGTTTTAGRLIFPAAAESPDFMALEAKTSGANDVVEVWCRRILKMIDIFEIGLTPVVNGTACNANTDKKKVIVALADGSADDLNGAVVYISELNEWRIILDSAYSSNVLTIDVNEDFTEAPTTTHHAYVFNFGFGDTAVKLGSSNPQRNIGNLRADRTGGKVVIHALLPKEKVAHIMFKD